MLRVGKARVRMIAASSSSILSRDNGVRWVGLPIAQLLDLGVALGLQISKARGQAIHCVGSNAQGSSSEEEVSSEGTHG